MKRVQGLAVLCLLVATGCKNSPHKPDHPQLTADVRLIDTTVHSRTLNRDMPLRIVVPTTAPADVKLPVVYLLHGAGDDYRSWSNDSSIAGLASKGLILVMPDEHDSYYINEATGTNHRYEDYFIDEVVPAVHNAVPYAASDREHTAIIGISRGGFGAVFIALKHPQLFSFVGGLSSALDLSERTFVYHRPLESLTYRKVFGKLGSTTRTDNDPFVLIRKASLQPWPYFYLSCGKDDSLLPTNRSFVSLLQELDVPHEFHLVPGAHNWGVWDAQLPSLEASLLQHLNLLTINKDTL